MQKLTYLLLLNILLFPVLQSSALASGQAPPLQDDNTAYESKRGTIADTEYRKMRREKADAEHHEKFGWWPTDAKPGAVRDKERGGYWWYPTESGSLDKRRDAWGNRGYIYVYKIIFDYKEEELPPAQPQELRPSLLIRKVIKNVKVYFDFDKSNLRDDAKVIIDGGIYSLKKNPKASVMITGNTDQRGSEGYNMALGKARSESVRQYLLQNGIPAEKIRIVSRGKLDAMAPLHDLVGMQKERNAQFVVAELEEVMLPYQGPPQGVKAQKIKESVYVTQEKKSFESSVQVSTREYVIQDGDTLSKIAKEELGSGHRWVYLYEVNKDRIDNPDRLSPGQKILIPVE